MAKVDYNTIVPQNIVNYLNGHGIKASFIADKAGYSRQIFYAILRGRRTMRPSDIVAISDALGMTPNDLFSLHEEAKEQQ